MVIQTGDNKFGVAKWIVDPVAGLGTHTTFTAAMASATAGETIVIRPGTYTENYTHKPGVNVVAFMGDGDVPNVTLNGQITYTGSGIASIGNIRLQTNSNFFLVVSGSNASVFYLNNCTLNCSNNTGISYTNSNAASAVLCYDCDGNIGTTGISLYSSSSAGILRFYECPISNSGMSTTASNNSAGTVVLTNTTFGFPISTTSTGGIISLNTFIVSTTAAIAVTHAGSTQSSMTGGGAFGLTQSAISVGSGALLALNLVDISSGNTNAITGAGTVAISGLIFSGSSSTINTTTQTRNVLYGGAYKGRATNTTPPAGMVGESISSFIPTASSITLSSPTASNVTSISLTPGIWDVSAICAFSGAVTGTVFVAAISTVSATLGTSGDNQIATPTAPTALSDNIIGLPRYRIELSATTTVYLVALGGFTVGTLKAYGRLSATRVA